ncbi:hypothetical protein JCM14469_39530 [Desulfatiferula olefinivorans]
MALDEARDTDQVYEVDGFKYIVDSEFIKEAAPIKVDYLDIGFKVTSNLKLESGCGGCSSTGSCGA